MQQNASYKKWTKGAFYFVDTKTSLTGGVLCDGPPIKFLLTLFYNLDVSLVCING